MQDPHPDIPPSTSRGLAPRDTTQHSAAAARTVPAISQAPLNSRLAGDRHARQASSRWLFECKGARRPYHASRHMTHHEIPRRGLPAGADGPLLRLSPGCPTKKMRERVEGPTCSFSRAQRMSPMQPAPLKGIGG